MAQAIGLNLITVPGSIVTRTPDEMIKLHF